jgi:hypothetical protein
VNPRTCLYSAEEKTLPPLPEIFAIHTYRHVYEWFRSEIGFIDHLQMVNTSNGNTITNFHTLQISAAQVKSFQSAFICRFLVTDPNSFCAPIKTSLHRLPYSCLSQVANSESELLYDWRFTADQFVLATSPLRLTTSNFIFHLNTWG